LFFVIIYFAAGCASLPQQQDQPETRKADIIIGGFIWPLKGQVVSQDRGLNIRASAAGQNVVSSRSGRVVYLDNDFRGYGKTIIIEHPEDFLTVYSGNSEILIKNGDEVKAGDLIAKSGKLLHFQIRKGYTAEDPFVYLQ
jgi:murein DD-endopeptidase MepM/ murein hydrolase activator NlpD